MKKTLKFLTSNPKKAQDFELFGFSVQSFSQEIPEILSPDVELVVLHKTKDTNLDKVVVEDTALDIEGAHFYGTEIKHVYEEIKNNDFFHGHKATWKVSLCARIDNKFYVATSQLEGILKYPVALQGYHFDKIFAIKDSHNEYTHFEMLPEKEKIQLGPRFQCLRKLSYALDNLDYSNLKVMDIKSLEPWSGNYQVENKKVHKKTI